MGDVFDFVVAADRAALMTALEVEPGLLGARHASGASLIAYAAYHGQNDLARELGQRAKPLDPLDAIIIGDQRSVEHALQAGWDANALSGDGFTPLALACFFSNEPAFQRLLPLTQDINHRANNPQQVAALHAATARRATGMVEALLRAGADPNLKQAEGFRPLHAAAQHGDLMIAGLLLVAGAHPRSETDSGKTAADYAREAGHIWLAGRLQRLM
jgi:ankyrin repeat protein